MPKNPTKAPVITGVKISDAPAAVATKALAIPILKYPILVAIAIITLNNTPRNTPAINNPIKYTAIFLINNTAAIANNAITLLKIKITCGLTFRKMKMKANAPINTEAHANAQSQLSSGKVKMLIDERVAKTKLMGTKVGQNMKPEERANYLKPFTLTSILKEEMMNLREENEGTNIILKQANRGIRKDKFSAFEYGLYYIKQEEDDKKKRKKFNAKEWLFMN